MAKLKVEDRRRRVVELREQGLSFRAIGRQLGVSHELVRRDARTAGLTVLTPAPSQLGPRGAAFFDWVRAEFELDRHEAEILEQTCRLLDRADALRQDVIEHGVILTTSRGDRRPNPAIAEERQVSLALGRLLAELSLPDPEGEKLDSPQTTRNRRAANNRWRPGRGA